MRCWLDSAHQMPIAKATPRTATDEAATSNVQLERRPAGRFSPSDMRAASSTPVPLASSRRLGVVVAAPASARGNCTMGNDSLRPPTHRLRQLAGTVLSVLASGVLAAGCGGADEPSGAGADRTLTVWILESEPDRIRATKDDVARFARETGLKVDVIGVGDDQLAQRVSDARRTGRLPDVMQLPMASAHAYARDGILDTDAAQDVVD